MLILGAYFNEILIFQFILENLTGNQEYVIKICAGTKRLSSEPGDHPLLGEASTEFKVFLPERECQALPGKLI